MKLTYTKAEELQPRSLFRHDGYGGVDRYTVLWDESIWHSHQAWLRGEETDDEVRDIFYYDTGGVFDTFDEASAVAKEWLPGVDEEKP